MLSLEAETGNRRQSAIIQLRTWNKRKYLFRFCSHFPAKANFAKTNSDLLFFLFRAILTNIIIRFAVMPPVSCKILRKI